ncbi:MAG: hypothetical protein R6V85_07725 [Polyangia bacterium]
MTRLVCICALLVAAGGCGGEADDGSTPEVRQARADGGGADPAAAVDDASEQDLVSRAAEEVQGGLEPQELEALRQLYDRHAEKTISRRNAAERLEQLTEEVDLDIENLFSNGTP